MKRPRAPLEQRFWAKVRMPADPYDCWEWTAATVRGYGTIGTGGRGCPNVLAHRYSFAHFDGILQRGEEVCHACNNPLCVNPYHLYAGTRADNMRQAQRQGRLRKAFAPWSAARRAAHERRAA